MVTDAGSTKRSVIEQMQPHLPAHAAFHPEPSDCRYGKVRSGCRFCELFEGRWWILTPPEGTDETEVGKLTRVLGSLWFEGRPDGCGHHDLVLAIVSHLPHLIAYNIVGTADDSRRSPNRKSSNIPLPASAISPALQHPTRLCGGMFACTTRMPFWKCWRAFPRTLQHCSA